MHQHLVVVGGGQAATQSIQSVRQLGFEGRISLVGAEPRLPYQRPPLSKAYLAGKLAAERLELRPANFYASRDVDLLLGRKAVQLDPGRKRLRLDDDATLDYDALILATGSRPRKLIIPGSELDGVHYLRTLDDVDGLRPELEKDRRLVIIGGGYIGLEVAAVARSLELDVVVIEAADRVLARVAGAELADFFTRYHRSRGVRIECGMNVTALAGNDRVTGVEVGTGARFDADLVLVAIGIVSNEELAGEAAIECGNGIAVDAFARTGADSVFAAGDCTAQLHPRIDQRVRLESVQNAIEQGKAAAASVVGQSQAFDDVPWFWSDQYDLKLQMAGLPLGYDSTVVRGTFGENAFCVFYMAGDRLVAAEAVNSPRDFMTMRKLLATDAKPTAAELADRDFDLSQYLTRS